MKKSIIIFSTALITLSLSAFGLLNENNKENSCDKSSCEKAQINNYQPVLSFVVRQAPELLYEVDSRFNTTITKENLMNAKSIIDILPKEATHALSGFKNVKVSLLDNDGGRYEISKDEKLNSAQIEILQSMDYSSNFFITSDCKYKNEDTGRLEYYDLVYYLTIIPEKEAEFTAGLDAFLSFIKAECATESAIIEREKLKPGKVSFTVAKDGNINKVSLESTSGYSTLDDRIIEVITSAPGTWKPATNSRGEKVDQQFTFFFGVKGC